MGILVHPDGMGMSAREVENMTVHQMIFWQDRMSEINKAIKDQQERKNG